jgi:hypothetical protein
MITQKDKYTKADIEYKLGVKRGRLQEWQREKHITPRRPASQGETAYFDRHNLYQIWHFMHLLQAGIPRHEAASLMGALSHKYLVRTEDIVSPPLQSAGAWQTSDEIPPFDPKRHKTYYIINVEQLKREVDEKLK